jgi:transcriptional regulator with XRE-family HTH domain
VQNNARVRFAESIVYLRRYRKLTQKALANKITTSQAAVARMEGARENITLLTLEKVVTALRGRLQLSIPPAEMNLPTMPEWWDLIRYPGIDAKQPYHCVFMAKQDGPPERLGAGRKGRKK